VLGGSEALDRQARRSATLSPLVGKHRRHAGLAVKVKNLNRFDLA
jgi:hypothetical protein